MLRFVILHHTRDEPRDSHFDWLFEIDSEGPLRTWACDHEVFNTAACELRCRALPPHRRDYLEYEGLLSGGRGRVDRWDRGIYKLVAQDQESFCVLLQGQRLQGTVRFLLSSGEWHLGWHPYPTGAAAGEGD